MDITESITNQTTEHFQQDENSQKLIDTLTQVIPNGLGVESDVNIFSSNVVEITEFKVDNSLNKIESVLPHENFENSKNSINTQNNQPVQISNGENASFGTKGSNFDIHPFKTISRPNSGLGCTIAKSPKFATDSRLRANKYPVEEEKPIDRQFKANPVNYKILEMQGGLLGVPKIPKRPLTKPMSPKFNQLHSKSRNISQSKLSPKSLRKLYTFKNPKYQIKKQFKFKEFQFVTEKFLKIKEERLKRRLEELEQKEKSEPKHHAGVVPHFPPPIQINPSSIPPTIPKPFHFESEDRCKRVRDKLQNDIDELEKSRKQFRANPMPSFNSPSYAKRASIPTTKPIPIHSAIEERLRQRKAFDVWVEDKHQKEKEEAGKKEKAKLEMELKLIRKRLEFHSKPAPDFTYKPLPKKNLKPSTIPRSPLFTLKNRMGSHRHIQG